VIGIKIGAKIKIVNCGANKNGANKNWGEIGGQTLDDD
jgi:hypothetical protein